MRDSIVPLIIIVLVIAGGVAVTGWSAGAVATIGLLAWVWWAVHVDKADQ